MQKFKKLLSIGMAAAMAFSMSLPAFAAEGDTTITVSGKGKTFSAWRLLNAEEVQVCTDATEGHKHTDTCYNYTYTLRADKPEYTEAMREVLNIPNTVTGSNLQNQIISNITVKSDEEMRTFADDVFKKLVTEAGVQINPDMEENAVVDSDTNTTTTTFTGPQGYYLIAEKTAADGNDALSLVMVDTAGKNALAVETKSDNIPTVEKTIVKENGDEVHGISVTTNSEVGFKLNGTVPAIASSYVKEYKYTFEDTLTNMTMKNGDTSTVAVKVVKEGEADIDITASSTISLTDNLLKVEIADAREYAGKNIVVTYTGIVGTTTTTGYDAINNTVVVKYTNDPYGNNPDSFGTTTPGGEDPNKPDNKTVIVVYDLDLYNIIKDTLNVESGADNGYTDDVKNQLDGAKFNVYYREDTTGEWTKLNADPVSALDPTAVLKNLYDDVTWNNVADGYFKVEQVESTPGYAVANDQFFSVNTTIGEDGWPSAVTVKGTTADGADSDKNIIVRVETLAADSTAELSIDGVIENAPGGRLPSTGGAGTLALYIGGVAAVMAAGAGVVVLKKKNTIEE